MAAFASTLRDLRVQVGYTSARSFFKGRGGAPHFGCTYRQYVNVEAGRSLPGPRLLEKISVGLRLVENPERARLFFTAYLQSVSRSEDLVRLIVTAFSSPGGDAPLLGSMARQAEETTRVLTAQQSEFIASKAEHYWPFTLLAEDRGHWSAHEISHLTGLPEASIKKSLEKLAAFKLLKKDKEGKFFCPEAGALFRHPRDKIYNAELPTLRELWDQMAAKKGVELAETSYVARASEAELKQYIPMLLQSLKACCVCSRLEKGPDTAFFQLQVRVRKLLPF